MYSMRRWSARYAQSLYKVYQGIERLVIASYPWLVKIGLGRADKFLHGVEKVSKGFFFDSQSCGQCTLGQTGMSCPMNCPKTIRNGPCGGVRPNGKCEVKADMDCVWVVAWEGTQHLTAPEQAIQIIQPPLDARLKGKSAWLRAAEQKLQQIPVRTV